FGDLASVLPVCRYRKTQAVTVDAPTPNRRAARRPLLRSPDDADAQILRISPWHAIPPQHVWHYSCTNRYIWNLLNQTFRLCSAGNSSSPSSTLLQFLE